MRASTRNGKIKEFREKIKRGRIKFGSAIRQANALGLRLVFVSKRGRRRA